ncbi:hypothetical protein U0070_018678, partial [Myodes glareolus]
MASGELKVDLVKTQHINGINIDIDKDVNCVSSECGIDSFGQRITDSFHLETVESQVIFDVIWSPKSTEKKGTRNYTGVSGSRDSFFMISSENIMLPALQRPPLEEWVLASNLQDVRGKILCAIFIMCGMKIPRAFYAPKTIAYGTLDCGMQIAFTIQELLLADSKPKGDDKEEKKNHSSLFKLHLRAAIHKYSVGESAVALSNKFNIVGTLQHYSLIQATSLLIQVSNAVLAVRDLGYPESHEHQQARLVQDVQIDHLCQQGLKGQQDPKEEGYQVLVNEGNPTVILLSDVNFNDYLQEVQQGQKDLEDPLHHGDQQDQKGRGCQQAQVHPKNGRGAFSSLSSSTSSTNTDAHKKMET